MSLEDSSGMMNKNITCHEMLISTRSLSVYVMCQGLFHETAVKCTYSSHADIV